MHLARKLTLLRKNTRKINNLRYAQYLTRYEKFHESVGNSAAGEIWPLVIAPGVGPWNPGSAFDA
jgi:hypothetical protein